MALGRGLGELLGEIETAYENGAEVRKNDILEINLDDITLNPYQPRKVFNEEKIQELSNSIVENGLLQPIVVTRDEDKYLLIAGERRYRATKLAGITLIKAIVLDVDNSKLRELALIENIQRDDLNIIEIAYSYAGLVNDYNITHDELAKLVSKSRSGISNTLRLLTLSNFTQKMLGANKITLGHAKLIVGLSEDEQQLIVDSIIGQKLSVRETEILVKKLKNNSSNITNTKQIDKNNLNYDSLKELQELFEENKLNIKIEKNYLKIKINSQEDIENIVTYFQK
ncbi:MAG: ParB/RepB/Spo0J family partition protein [Campylobacterota bacterium]|nr:ParB/RepB/Spo0J family partition protein [Campylobacterota bacterium]